MTTAGRLVPSFVMDRPTVQTPVLHPILREVAESDRLREFAAALPVRARVSEPALPLVVAALFEELGRGLVLLAPEDADARDVAEAAAWYLGDERVAFLPSRGVCWESGLAPPPHLVGERARALDVLAVGGLVCASAAALAERMPPPDARPEPVRVEVGMEPGIDALAEELALAGYERVERVEDRGQFAVRGGIVDIFPTTGREPIRVELFGDEIEQVRAFSPFTQRALHPVDGATLYPAAERRIDLLEPTLADDDEVAVPDDLVPPLDRVPDLVWEPDEVRRVWREDFGAELTLDGAAELDQLPSGQPFAFEAQRPALAARGLAEAEKELAAAVRGGNRVVVTFAHKGEALRTQNLLRCVDAVYYEEGDHFPREPELLFAVAPARRGFVWRELGLALLPDTQVFRKRAPRTERLGRALQSFSDLRTGDYVVHEDHGVGKLLGFETKTVAGVTRDYLFLAFRGEDRLYVPHEQIGKVSRYIGADASAPTLSKLGGKAWDRIKSRAREGVRELAGELIQLYATRQTSTRPPYALEHEYFERLEAEFPYRETEDQQRAIEAVKEDLEAPNPMDRLVCGDVGFGKTEVAVRAAFAVALNGKQTLMLVPTTVL
ncbi:MAG TPA: CarD family transcriptional regulator, partial [Gaiellaceae bacterium]|nr:CarD family transcriptional regulator [Gaiellaceae bacterium]